MNIAKRLIPQWTKKVAFEAGGRDPLGLSRVSDLIKGQLLRGIVSNNNRARYYSYFCWAFWHIEQEETARRYKDFETKYRRREAVLALATLSNNSKTSMLIGVDEAKLTLIRGKERKEVDCDFRVLPSNPLGAFGQYFRGSLYELGLYTRTEDGIYHAAPGEGEALARTVHAVAQKTPYVKNRLFGEMRLSLNDLTKSQQYLTLDAIREPFAAQEREQLIEAFFKFTGRKLTEFDLSRRHTLALILHVVSEYEKHGSRAGVESINDDIVYPAYYYDTLQLSERKAVAYKCPDVLRPAHSMWKQFGLHQFFTQAMEDLLEAVLDAVGGELSGLVPEDLVTKLLGREFYASLKELTDAQCKKPADLFGALGIDNVPDEKLSLRLQKEVGLLHDLAEVSLWLGFEDKTPQNVAACAFTTLAILYGKWRGVKGDSGFVTVSRQAGQAFWMRSVFPHFDSWVMGREVTWEEVMRTVIEGFVLGQHYRIMRERRKPDSLWVHMDEGRITKEQDFQATLRTSRHENAVNIMLDLLLLKSDSEGGLSVTARGKQIVKKVLGEA